MRYLLVLIACLGGCHSHEVIKERYEGGELVERTSVKGRSTLTNKGIAKAQLEGVGELEGYSANPNAEALKAVAEGAVNSIIRNTPVPKP